MALGQCHVPLYPSEDFTAHASELENVLAIQSVVEKDLLSVEAALRDLDTDDYGLCRQCQQPIPIERLRALPSAQFCVQCQAQEEITLQLARYRPALAGLMSS